jgi:hypothetical protein
MRPAVVPLAQFLDDAVRLPATDKLVGAARLLLQGGRLIELDLYGFTDEAQGFDFHWFRRQR